MNLEERLSRCLDNIMARNDDIKQLIRNKTRSSGNILQYDKKVSSKLKEIIDISQSRFRLVKMGNSVESILNNSPKIPKLSSEILNSPIQENLETIDKTKNILKKKFASNFSLRSNFQFKHLNEKEGEEENKKEKGINEYNRKKNLERFQYILEQKLNKEQKDLNENITKHLKKTNSMIIKYTDLFKKAGDDIPKISHALQQFLDERNEIPPLEVKSELLQYQKINPDQKILERKINKCKSELNILSYKNYLNIQSCSEYLGGKEGQKKFFKKMKLIKNPKKSSEENQNNISVDINNNFKSNEISKISNSIQKYGSFKEDKNIYNNTGKLLLNQAIKNFSVDENIFEKRKNINHLIDKDLPSIRTYDKIYKSKLNKIKEDTKQKETTEKEEEALGSIEDEDYDLWMSTQEQLDLEEKQKQKEETDKIKKQIEEKKKMMKRIKEEVLGFIIDEEKSMKAQELSALEKLTGETEKRVKTKKGDLVLDSKLLQMNKKRSLNLYNDQYSLRDKFVNDMNIQFNKVLGKQDLTSDEVEDLLNKFYDEKWKINLKNEHLKKEKYRAYLKELYKRQGRLEMLPPTEKDSISEISESKSETESNINKSDEGLGKNKEINKGSNKELNKKKEKQVNLNFLGLSADKVINTKHYI